MDPKIVKSVTNKVYRQFPEMAGVQPKIRNQVTSAMKSKPAGPGYPATYLLTYQTKVQIPGANRMLPRWVRVVVNSQGKIIKITTSH